MGHHVPCHLKALGRPPGGPALLALIPGLRVHTIDVSCSGMAGTFGLKATNYDASLEAGRPMLEELARPRVLFGSTECSTCRMQMEDGGRQAHPAPGPVLALAYGLLPRTGRPPARNRFGGLVLSMKCHVFACSPVPATWPARSSSPSSCPTAPRSPTCAAWLVGETLPAPLADADLRSARWPCNDEFAERRPRSPCSDGAARLPCCRPVSGGVYE